MCGICLEGKLKGKHLLAEPGPSHYSCSGRGAGTAALTAAAKLLGSAPLSGAAPRAEPVYDVDARSMSDPISTEPASTHALLRKLPKPGCLLHACPLFCVHLVQGGWLGKDSAPRLAFVEYLWVQRDSGKDGGHHGRDGAAGSQRRWGANVALRSGLL